MIILPNEVLAREGEWFIISKKLSLGAMGGWEGAGLFGRDGRENEQTT